MKLKQQHFLWYKLLNSSFTGLSIGIIFTIYKPLEKDPAIFSVGGIVLACGMLLIAEYYEKLLNIRKFFQISMGVELVMLITVLAFIILKITFTSALLIYIGYQLTFIFGGYLVRAETLIAKEKEFLGKIDYNKQLGYLLGLGTSFIFYKTLEYGFDITENAEMTLEEIKKIVEIRLNMLHYLLLALQSIIILILANSFSWR